MSDCRAFRPFESLYFTFLLCLSSIPMRAQLGQVTGSTPFLPTSQWENPAFISEQSFETLQLDFSGKFWLSNNQFTLEDLVRGGNAISTERKNGIISQLGEDNRFQQGFDLGGILNFRLGKQIWLLSIKRQQSLYLRVDDSVSAGLLFRGNAPYVGREIKDDRVEWRNLSYTTFGLGSSWQQGPFSWGFHAKLVKGISAQVVDRLSYTLFTTETGNRIDLQADYDGFTTTRDTDGWGVGIDLGASYQLAPDKILDLAVKNLGMINWEGIQSTNQVDVQYDGVTWDNFIQNGGTTSLAIGDTLQQLIFPDSVEGNFTYTLPSSARIGLRVGTLTQGVWTLAVSQALTNFAPTTPLPLVQGGYMRKIKNLSGGIHAHLGGMELYGLGIWGELQIPFSTQTQMGIYANFPNILGLVAPEISRELNVQGGIYLKL